jgi:glyoxylate/hydroxypyruvate reductase A
VALLISVSEFWEDEKVWRQWVQSELPEIDVRVYPDVGNENEIEYAVVWKHPHGILKRYPNLKAILSLGAGVDHILSDPDLPKDLPIVRLVDVKLTHEMCFHALHWVLHFHSDHYLYMKQQLDRKWHQQGSIQPEDRTVGIMGLGNIGRGIGESLIAQGFKVLGWGANQKSSLGDIKYFFGKEQLSDFLVKTNILINVLPFSKDTKNMLRKEQLQILPRGSFIINMGRGGIINEADLLSLLDENHITAAALDVFEQEPLPTQNPLWNHPSVYITPHIAGQSNPKSSAKTIAENIRRIDDGEMPFPIYNIAKGY